MTRQELVDRADKSLENMLDDHEKADYKRGWNKITGQQRSKNDVVRDGVAHLEFLNTVAQAKGWDNVWHEETDVKLPKGTVS